MPHDNLSVVQYPVSLHISFKNVQVFTTISSNKTRNMVMYKENLYKCWNDKWRTVSYETILFFLVCC